MPPTKMETLTSSPHHTLALLHLTSSHPHPTTATLSPLLPSRCGSSGCVDAERGTSSRRAPPSRPPGSRLSCQQSALALCISCFSDVNLCVCVCARARVTFRMRVLVHM